MTGTPHIWNSSPRRHPRGARATHTGRRRREAWPRPGKEANRDQCHRLFEGKTRRLVEGHPSVVVCVRGTAFSGDGGVLAPPTAVRRTQTCGMGDSVIDRVRRSTSTSPWSTRSLAPLSGCRSATRWKAELPSMPIEAFEWTW